MSTITLTGNMFSRSMGVEGFFDLGQAFSNLKQTASSLTTQLNTLKNKIDVASTVATVDTSTQQVSNSESREETKKSSLSLVYEKLDEFIANVDDVDDKVSTKVEELKDDFYSKYSYLKPESEKGFWERVGDGAKALWDGLCDIGNAIADVAVGVVEWCKEHWKEILVGLVFIALGALITVFTGGTGTAFWAAFGAAFLKGLGTAAISMLIGGVVSGGVTYYQFAKAGFSHEVAMKNAMRAFGDGAANGFMTAGIGFAAGAGTLGILGEGFLKGHSFWGSIGKGALFGAITNSATDVFSTMFLYYFENGTIKGSMYDILNSFFIGGITGGITGGIVGGVQYKYAEYRISSIENNIKERTDMSPQDQGRLWGTEGFNEYTKRYPNTNCATQGRLSSDDLVNKNGISSYSMPDQLVEAKLGEFINYDYKWGNAKPTYNQGVLTGITGTTAGTGNGTSHVMETIFSTTKGTVMYGNFSTNIIPVGTPFIQVHPWDFNSIFGVPINSNLIVSVDSIIDSIMNTIK